MLQQPLQFIPPKSDIGVIVQIIFSAAFLLYLLYAQRIQSLTMLRQVE